MPEPRMIGLSKKEAQFVRTLIRVDTDLEADELLDGQQLTVTWEQARELGLDKRVGDDLIEITACSL